MFLTLSPTPLLACRQPGDTIYAGNFQRSVHSVCPAKQSVSGKYAGGHTSADPEGNLAAGLRKGRPVGALASHPRTAGDAAPRFHSRA